MNTWLPLAQAAGETFWSKAPGSSQVWVHILVGLIVGAAVIFAMLKAPSQARRPIVVGTTFFAGLYNVLLWLWPTPIDRQPGELPTNPVEGFAFWLEDANPVVANFRSIIAGFLIGLGIYSLLNIHLKRVAKQQKDWGFSVVLLVSMFVMAVVGFIDYNQRQGPDAAKLDNPANWTWANTAQDFLFEGLLQQMDAAMFSLIAFYILSAAYRAFRARSTEAGILLGTALLLMLSLLGGATVLSDGAIDAITGGNANHFMNNFKLGEIAGWLRDNVQGSAIRGLQFGVGIGLLALSLRIWLSLEKTGRVN